MMETTDTAMPAARRVTRPLLTKAQLVTIDRMETQWRGIIGGNIRKARQAAGLTLEQLAARADISRNHLSLAELGRTSVTISFLTRVAFALQLSPSDFLKQD